MSRHTKSIEKVIKELQDKFGEDSIIKLNQKPQVGLNAIPTGSSALDMALGIGGLPRGRVIEIFGPESSGKTTLALSILAEAQKKGDACAYIDAEHSLDPDNAKSIGVNTDDMYLSQPSSGEEALTMVETLVHSNKFGVIVIDSVAALTPQKEIEGDMGAQQMGAQARLMGQAMRKLVGIIRKTNTLVIFINQIRVNFAWGSPETTPGGKALKFYSSVRIDLRKTSDVAKSSVKVGIRVRAKVAKNKVASPFKVAEYDIIFGKGIIDIKKEKI